MLYRSSRLSATARQAIENADEVYVSTLSTWELALKYKKGKLPFTPQDIAHDLQQTATLWLPLAPGHISNYTQVELPHNDPFDTMLVAQAVAEGLTLVTADRQLLASEYMTIEAC